MSRIHFVGGEKGGVGKSVFARLLCGWLVDQGDSVAALDADPGQGALLLSYPEYGHAVDLSLFESADRIMDRALSAEREVVVDLPAHSHRALLRWLHAGDVFNLAEETEVEIIFWLVTDGGFDSVSALETLLPQLDPRAKLRLVRNHRWEADFSQLGSSEALQTLRDEHALDLPKLDPRAMYQMQLCGLSYQKALVLELDDKERGLSAMQRRRTQLWLQDCYQRLESLIQSEQASPEPTSAPDPIQPRALSEEACPEPSSAPDLIEPPAPGTSRIDGARTWTEVGDTYQIHHVRYP